MLGDCISVKGIHRSSPTARRCFTCRNTRLRTDRGRAGRPQIPDHLGLPDRRCVDPHCGHALGAPSDASQSSRRTERGTSPEQARRRAPRSAPTPAAGDTGDGAQASGLERACQSRPAACRRTHDQPRFGSLSGAFRAAADCRDATRTGTLQGAVHRVPRNARQAAAQDLLRHAIPNGDAAAIFDRALTLLLADLEQAKFAATAHPRAARPAASGSRHIPAAVRREVWKRDDGRCAFVGTHGRCTERGFLEFHHVVLYAEGGATVAENLELRCRAHNIYEAEQYSWSPIAAAGARGRWPQYRWRLGPDREHENESTSHVSAKSQLAALHSRIVQQIRIRRSLSGPEPS